MNNNISLEPTEQATAVVPTKLLRIAIGSTNPAKIRAVEQAMRRILDAHNNNKQKNNNNQQEIVVTIQAVGFNVESGVPHQPMGDHETCLGAKNRASAAYFAYRKAYDTVPHLAFGLEGGLEHVDLPTMETNNDNGEKDQQLYCMAWIAVYGKRSAFTVDLLASHHVKTYHGDRTPKFGLGKTGTFAIPPKVADLIDNNGLELGHANDQVFDSTESKTGQGAVGLLTGGIIDRSAYYEHAIMLAMTPWFRPDVYP